MYSEMLLILLKKLIENMSFKGTFRFIDYNVCLRGSGWDGVGKRWKAGEGGINVLVSEFRGLNYLFLFFGDYLQMNSWCMLGVSWCGFLVDSECHLRTRLLSGIDF